MKNLITLINNKNYENILKWAASLTDDERYKALDKLTEIDLDKDVIKKEPPKNYNKEFYENRAFINSVYIFTQIVCLRNFNDLSKTAPEWNKRESLLHTYLRNPIFGTEPIVEYFKLFPPDYLDKLVTQISRDRQTNINFILALK